MIFEDPGTEAEDSTLG